jgi:hypothetical protein
MTYSSSSLQIHCPQHSVRVRFSVVPHNPQQGTLLLFATLLEREPIRFARRIRFGRCGFFAIWTSLPLGAQGLVNRCFAWWLPHLTARQ